MIEIRKTDRFATWLDRLRDLQARARIQARIERLALGNPGDVKPVGEGVLEMRIDHGPGYRIYYVRHGATIVILLCAGDKRTQTQDIKRAHAMARDIARRQ